MKADVLLEQLEDAATLLRVRVSYETLLHGLAGSLGHGGLCRVRGEYRVIINKSATTQERLATLASALARIDTAGVELPKKVRELLDFHAPAPSRRAS